MFTILIGGQLYIGIGSLKKGTLFHCDNDLANYSMRLGTYRVITDGIPVKLSVVGYLSKLIKTDTDETEINKNLGELISNVGMSVVVSTYGPDLIVCEDLNKIYYVIECKKTATESPSYSHFAQLCKYLNSSRIYELGMLLYLDDEKYYVLEKMHSGSGLTTKPLTIDSKHYLWRFV